MPFRESDNVSGILDLELNNRNDFDFDARLCSEGSGHNNPIPTDYALNEFTLGDPPTLAPEQSDQTSCWGDVVLSTEAPLGNNEMTAIPQQNQFRDHHCNTQLSRARSPQRSNIDWEDYVNLSPSTRSSVGALAATPNILYCPPRQSSIFQSWDSLSREPFLSDDSIRATSGPDETFEGTDLEAVTKPLKLMEDVFFASLSKISENQSSGIIEDVTESLASEFRNLLPASHETSASVTRKRSGKSETNEASWTPLSHNKFWAHIDLVAGYYYGSRLQAAALKGHGIFVSLLLSRGADPNCQGGYHGMYVLNEHLAHCTSHDSCLMGP